MKTLTEWTLANLPESIAHYCACRHGFTDIVRQLISLEYPKMSSKANLVRLLEDSRDGGLLQMFLK